MIKERLLYLPPRQAQAAAGDDIPLNLAGTGGNRQRHRKQVELSHPSLQRRPGRSRLHLTAQAQYLHP